MMDEAVNSIVKLVRRLGFGEGYGVVFAHLLLSEKPLTVRQLARLTGYSASAVAMYLSVLHRNYLVERRKVGNTYVYSARLDYLERWRDWVKNLIEKDIDPLINSLRSLAQDIDEGEKKLHILRVLSEFERTRKFLERVLEMEY